MPMKVDTSVVKVTKTDIEGVLYAIDILEDQLLGGSQDPATLTNQKRLKRLLVTLEQLIRTAS
jgi:hypothetical protein